MVDRDLATDEVAAVRPGPGLRLARIVTELTAPAVLVSLLTVVIGWHSAQGTARGLGWGLVAVVFVSLIPMAYILGGVRRGRLTDHHIRVREQRRVPLLFGLGSVAAGLALLAVLGAPRPVLALVAAGLVGLLVAVTVSHWWKMSIHSAVAAGTLVVLVVTFGTWLLLATPLLGLVGWSRVRLGDHTPAQVLTGGLLGALVAAVVYALLR
ncbi:phosphatase PAP2 family protein [Micromonospora sp. DT229]|uniref:phosphatase PAP2 family protein n=1 Tax=Micromonospora sp. DT229 TaxID=3393430 RepID=UPI003CF79474